MEWEDREDWSAIENDLFERMAHDTDALNDPQLQNMFDLGWFDNEVSPEIREHARDWVADYVYDEYGFDFDEYFDWDAWREAYSET